jgi:hypothetical protein
MTLNQRIQMAVITSFCVTAYTLTAAGLLRF